MRVMFYYVCNECDIADKSLLASIGNRVHKAGPYSRKKSSLVEHSGWVGVGGHRFKARGIGWVLGDTYSRQGE